MLSKLKFYLIRPNIIAWTAFPYFSLFIWILPLLFFGILNNSLMSHDEGLYAWRSRLMYDSGDWINPWENPHHKTPGFYWLIAVFYSLFGINEIIVRLPNIICGILSVFLVYEIGKIFLNKQVAWLAGAILTVEFLWLQYSRLGTPDVPMVFLVLLGIWSLLKAELNPKYRYIWGLIAGFCFALGFLMRSFMIFLPIIALSPYLILGHRRHHHLVNPMLYVGFLFGLVPTIIWLKLSSSRFGYDSFGKLANFVVQQGSNERRNNNWLYYFWHVPTLAFPWSLHGLLGTGLLIGNFLSRYNHEQYNYNKHLNKNHEKYRNDNHNKYRNQNKEQGVTATLQEHLSVNPQIGVQLCWDESTTGKAKLKDYRYIEILVGFPLILFIELTIFSTRLSHYSLCLYPFIALLASVGLTWLGMIWDRKEEDLTKYDITLFSKFHPIVVSLSLNRILQSLSYGFGILGIIIFLGSMVVFFVSDSDGEIRNYAIIGLFLGLSWLVLYLVWIARCRFGKNLITSRYWIAAWLISSWLTLAATGSLGFLSNYNPDFKAFIQQPEVAQILKNNNINFVDVGGKTGVLINFYTQKHGKRININEISQLPASSYAWIGEKQASEISRLHSVVGEVQRYKLIKLE